MNINGGIYVGVDRRGVFCLEVREGENELGQALCDEVEGRVPPGLREH